jgi:hypothetical protein
MVLLVLCSLEAAGIQLDSYVSPEVDRACRRPDEGEGEGEGSAHPAETRDCSPAVCGVVRMDGAGLRAALIECNWRTAHVAADGGGHPHAHSLHAARLGLGLGARPRIHVHSDGGMSNGHCQTSTAVWIRYSQCDSSMRVVSCLVSSLPARCRARRAAGRGRGLSLRPATYLQSASSGTSTASR